MIKRLGVLAVAIVMGIGIGFAGNAYLEEDATAAGGWTFAQFKWQGNGWFWSAGSSDWYGNMDESQSLSEFLSTIPVECQVDMEQQGSDDDLILVFFPSAC
jgi:hypothetical protein